MLQTEQYVRKPFYVDAVQVTEENMDEVATWCNGDIRTKRVKPGDVGKHIKVRVNRPMSERHSEAYPGDWILYAGSGYKVYEEKVFAKIFEKAADSEDLREELKKELIKSLVDDLVK